MKTVTVILICFFSALNVSSQTFSKKDFGNTEWFTNNLDNFFYKSDTIILIKYSNVHSKNLGFNEYSESEQKYLHHGYYIHFQFLKNGKMNLWEISYEKGSKSKIDERTWTFDEKNNCLEIKRNNKVEFCFVPFYQKEIELESQYYNEMNWVKTIEIKLVKNK